MIRSIALTCGLLFSALCLGNPVVHSADCSPKLEGYQQFLLVLKKDQDIGSSILACLQQAKLNSAIISGIGTVLNPLIAYYEPVTKQYVTKRYRGFYQMNALMGNMSELNGKKNLHLHITVGKSSHKALSGHFIKAIVGANAEIVVTPIKEKWRRQYDKSTQMNLFK